MNKLEKAVYDHVKSNPKVKFLLRNLYQSLFDLLPRQKDQSYDRIDSAPGFFYGFHDKSPFSEDESRILALQTTIAVRMPEANEPCSVGYFDFDSERGTIESFHKLADSYGWNYHKGCRLQWKDNDVIYNSIENDKPVAKVINMRGELVHEYPFAIDTLSPDGCWATSFSYERLNALMPGYGYEFCHDNGCLSQNAPQNTGLYLADLRTGSLYMLYSLRELAQSVNEPDIMEHKHYVTHTEFSPDGRYVSFLHRWIGDDYRKRTTRLIIYDRNSGKMQVLPTCGMVSHYIWNINNQIIAYCNVREGDAHVMFDIDKGGYEPVLLGKLNMDGHQSMIDEYTFITDTYPDNRRMASLLKVSIVNQTMERIAYFFSPKTFQTKDFHCHIACDLHPRVSPSGRYVCFDSVFTGQRSLCVMKI